MKLDDNDDDDDDDKSITGEVIVVTAEADSRSCCCNLATRKCCGLPCLSDAEPFGTTARQKNLSGLLVLYVATDDETLEPNSQT